MHPEKITLTLKYTSHIAVINDNYYNVCQMSSKDVLQSKNIDAATCIYIVFTCTVGVTMYHVDVTNYIILYLCDRKP